MLKMNGVGHQKLPRIKKPEKNKQSILIYRRWRLGDIIMCEPVNRYWYHQGYDVFYCSMSQYHPVIKAYSESPPKTINYHISKDNKMINPMHHSDVEYNLDSVGLLHDGHISKVEAFLHEANIDYNNIDKQYKTPKIEVGSVHQSWAKMFLSDQQLNGQPLIAAVRQSFSAQSPRSINIQILDELYSLLSKDFHVIVIGDKPTNINISGKIHNFTGCTPDIMSVAGLLSQCKLLITGDTGLMHLAGSIGLPMVSILGPTRPHDISSFYQYNSIIDAGRDCSPCFDNGCDDKCLNSIDVELIYKEAINRINYPFIDTMITKF